MTTFSTVIFLIIAVVIFLRLRSVLGQRTGNERPRIDPRFSRDAQPPDQGKVVSLPRISPPQNQPAPEKAPEQKSAVDVAPETPLAASLKTIARADGKFDVQRFLKGAKAAYELVIGAFASGDRATLKKLLSSEMYDGFDHVIAERIKAGEKVESRFVGIDKEEIMRAELKGKFAQIAVRFVSNIVQATYNGKGEVVEGDPSRIAEVTDIWTFERDITSADPNWRLIATEDMH